VRLNGKDLNTLAFLFLLPIGSSSFVYWFDNDLAANFSRSLARRRLWKRSQSHHVFSRNALIHSHNLKRAYERSWEFSAFSRYFNHSHCKNLIVDALRDAFEQERRLSLQIDVQMHPVSLTAFGWTTLMAY